jgi:hypothetical protein
MKEKDELKFRKLHTYHLHKVASRPLHTGEMTPTLILLYWVLQVALQAAWAEILVETASSFHGLDSPSKAALILGQAPHSETKNNTYFQNSVEGPIKSKIT